MLQIKFIVNSIPVAQPRQRHSLIVGKSGKSFINNYIPAKDPVNAFKAICQLSASQVFHGAPMEDPIKIFILAVFPRPKSKIWKSRPMPREYKTSKPDFDNLGKSVCDALTGLVWRDDAQIVDGRVQKCIAAGNEQPHVEITIESMSWVWEEIKF